jgi:hypothetical protein
VVKFVVKVKWLFETFGAFTQKAGGKTVQEILYIPRTEEAIAKALELGAKERLPVLGTGSFYLTAEIKRSLLRKIPRFRQREGAVTDTRAYGLIFSSLIILGKWA